MTNVNELRTATEKYVRQFYDLLVEGSELEYAPVDTFPLLATRLTKERLSPTDIELRIFRGKLTELFTQLGASQNYYRRIRRILVEYGCITYLERGTKAYDSVLVLNHEPPKEISPEHLTGTGGPATVQALAERVGTLEHHVEALQASLGGINLQEALVNIEHRLPKESEVAAKREV